MSNEIGPFSTAVEMLAALDAKQVSSVELVEMHLARIDKLDEALNAIPVRTPRARARGGPQCRRAARGRRVAPAARAADDAQGVDTGRGSAAVGRHHAVQGLPTRGTMDPSLAACSPRAAACSARPTSRSRSATGRPTAPSTDATNNPWDLDRTPGGSTGGGAAALAAGFTPLEIGSDIGGSIRVPAAYCGVYGHRPSETAVPRTGSFPLADRPNPAVVMAVQGPLARSATDLELLFDVVAGPDALEADRRGGSTFPRRATIGWPTSGSRSCRRCRSRSRRPRCRRRSTSSRRCCRAAARRSARRCPTIDHESYFRDYMTVLIAITSQAQPRERARGGRGANGSDQPDPVRDGD